MLKPMNRLLSSMQAFACSTGAIDVGGVMAQVKELALQVLPVELVAASAEPAPAAEEALPALETHQVRSWLGRDDLSSQDLSSQDIQCDDQLSKRHWQHIYSCGHPHVSCPWAA